MKALRHLLWLVPALGLFALSEVEHVVTQRDCTFSANPDEFLSASTRARDAVHDRVRKLSLARSAAADAAPPPRRNFIDEEIFRRLEQAGVQPAALSGDEEFLRRVTLDLTGRIPTAAEVREFVASADAAKRDAVIERLLASSEFTDKWTMWFGDLLQNTSFTLSTQSIPRRAESRNAFHKWIRDSVAVNKSVRDMAWESIAQSGNSFDAPTGSVNFALGGQAAMGPIQDSFDQMMVKSTTAFLGLAHYDCLSCHNGRGHLDQLSYWGRNTLRSDAWKMAAFFSRTRWTVNNRAAQLNADPKYDSVDLYDTPRGTYDLNTNAGNRPGRCAGGAPLDEKTGRCAATATVAPAYHGTGTTPADGNWRAAFADNLTRDPMFGRNFANRLWKAMFNLGLVDPVDTLDPWRLDPKNPPPQPWSLQATHPELLDKLAEHFMGTNADLRAFLRLIAQSSAYQLSSSYPGDWKYEYTPLFARHYPRRLDAEEVADAIASATGNVPRITWALASRGAIPVGSAVPQSDPVTRAMQLPDTIEGGGIAGFLNVFLRGNRDTQLRSQNGSILQQLGLMNDNFVLQRIRMNNSPVLREIAKIASNEELVNEMYVTFLGRQPSPQERAKAADALARPVGNATRNNAVEDLAWALINKTEFIWSY